MRKIIKIDKYLHSNAETKQFEGYEILISYGGGMGGANITYFTETFSREDNFVTFQDVFGNEIESNSNFIVSITKKKIIIFTIDLINESAFIFDKDLKSVIKTFVHVLNLDEDFILDKEGEKAEVSKIDKYM